MKNILTIVKRELKSYFYAPATWLFIVVFLLAVSIYFFFVQQFIAADRADLRAYFNLLTVFLSVLVPALTMKTWAEEKRQGTYEILITLPFSEYELVIGKFLSSFTIILAALLSTAGIPLCVSFFGYFDIGQIIAQYVGIVLFASSSCAIGLFVSSCVNSQISAFIITLLILVLQSLLGQATLWFAMTGPLAKILNWISSSYHYISFSKGVLDSRDILYFLLLLIASLYGTMVKIYFGRWR
jgi:ABC-2 type transport system permease protein